MRKQLDQEAVSGGGKAALLKISPYATGSNEVSRSAATATSDTLDSSACLAYTRPKFFACAGRWRWSIVRHHVDVDRHLEHCLLLH